MFDVSNEYTGAASSPVMPPSIGSRLPILPVSNALGPPVGSGKFDTYVPQPGHAHDVNVCRAVETTSSLMTVSSVPLVTCGKGTAPFTGTERSPGTYRNPATWIVSVACPTEVAMSAGPQAGNEASSGMPGCAQRSS